ncbi:MAG: phospho-sugar mutase, partial [Acidimicrobiia bacterium]|nr:phospho-sugar mutase [Acidimicrobiia bacterium]
TPLHGVGGEHVVRQLAAAGYTSVTPVPQQYEPDGHFPTVSFPNPEEPGALDLAKALAAEGAELVVANDPDADRLAAAVPVDGEFRTLSGNQIGLLLADYVLTHTDVEHPLVVNSIVSSPMLGSIAAAHGARWEQTLTGFKWIWNAALDLADDVTYVFGFEEALGYSVGPYVRDKDGIATLVIFVDMASGLARRGESVLDRWYQLAADHGLWVSTQKSVVRPGTEGAGEIRAAMELIENSPPADIDGIAVEQVTDFSVGAEQRPRWLAETPLVELSLGAQGRVLVRPSGTEPKLKIYVDLRAEVGDRDPAVLEQELLGRANTVAAATATYLGFD